MMQKVNVANLSGAALDWAVAVCEGLPIQRDPMGFSGIAGGETESGYWVWYEYKENKSSMLIGRNYSPHENRTPGYSPCQNFAQGGPILDRELISLAAPSPIDDHWTAMTWQSKSKQNGETSLIAAMRCYVAKKMGETIDVPDYFVRRGDAVV